MPVLNWIGKEKIVNYDREIPYKFFEKKYDFGKTSYDNRIIHGDNLIALKSLLPEFNGSFDFVYIDPPYNTGNKMWIYNDNVDDPTIKKWLGTVVGTQAQDLTRHDKWLCMMYPRLKLIHKLLKEEGILFCSIDENEDYNLRILLNEIFGTSNFIGTLTWESTTQPTNAGNAKYALQKKCESILAYAKNKEYLPPFLLERKETNRNYPSKDSNGNKCRLEIIEKSDAGGYNRETMKFEILGIKPRPGKRWQIGKETADELIKKNRLTIVNGVVKKIVYPEDEIHKDSAIPFWSFLPASEVGTAQSGKEDLKRKLGRDPGFDTVKPIELIKNLLRHFKNNIRVLDAFAGSGSTGDAVMSINEEDGGKRTFVEIEVMDYAESIMAQRTKNIINGFDNKKGFHSNFTFYEIGKPLLIDNQINEEIDFEDLRNYISYTELGVKAARNKDEMEFINSNCDCGYYLFHNKEGNCGLTIKSLAKIKSNFKNYIVYADFCNLSNDLMEKNNISFKKIPDDIIRY